MPRDFIDSQPQAKIDDRQVAEASSERDRQFTTGDREIGWMAELEYKVRRLINDYVVSPKNEFKLNRWLEWAERFNPEI